MATTKIKKADQPEDDTEVKDQQIAVDDGSGPEPHEINSSLDSDRMRALLADHRKDGARP